MKIFGGGSFSTGITAGRHLGSEVGAAMVDEQNMIIATDLRNLPFECV
jgi:hypothetical protein